MNAAGVEGLFIEQIVRSLRPGGKALVIVPDGILNRSTDEKLRAFVRDECILEGVVSLPKNAFYTTTKKTYILALAKKPSRDVVQTDPVFSYVVTQTGETLDSNRFECENDLPEMVRLFKYFKADKQSFRSDNLKCKVWPIARFDPASYWSVDRWWTTEERKTLGIVESQVVITVSDFAERLEAERNKIEEAKQRLLVLEEQVPKPELTQEISLGDRQFFELFIGDRKRKKDYHGKPQGPIPVFSADMITPFAWDTTSNIESFDYDFVLWGIDSNLFRFRVMPKGTPFRTTDHCGCIRIIDPDVDASYLRHRLIAFSIASTLDRQLRPSLRVMRRVSIPFPVQVDSRGRPRTKPAERRENLDDPETVPLLDLKLQQETAAFYDTFDAVKRELAERMQKLAALELEPLGW